MAMEKMNLNDEQLNDVTGGTILPYKVEANDTLEKIALKYHVSVEQLMKWNNITDPGILKAGMLLKVKF